MRGEPATTTATAGAVAAAAVVLAMTSACRNGGTTSAVPIADSRAPIHGSMDAMPPPISTTVSALDAVLWPGDEIGAYVAMGASDRAALASAVVGLWRGELSHASAVLPIVGHHLARYQIDGAVPGDGEKSGGGGDASAGAASGAIAELVGVIGDDPGALGRGVYLVREGVANALLLQAPHPYFDQFTEQIALAWLVESSPSEAPRALFAGSIHRYWQPDGVRGPRDVNRADVSHNGDHEFNAMTSVIGAETPGLVVVQVHGFGGEPAGFDIVVSSGTKAPSLIAATVARDLRALGYRVALYPIDTNELGATTNAQRRALARYGAGFVHIELARAVRERLIEDAGARGAMWRSISHAVRASTSTP